MSKTFAPAPPSDVVTVEISFPGEVNTQIFAAMVMGELANECKTCKTAQSIGSSPQGRKVRICFTHAEPVDPEAFLVTVTHVCSKHSPSIEGMEVGHVEGNLFFRAERKIAGVGSE